MTEVTVVGEKFVICTLRRFTRVVLFESMTWALPGVLAPRQLPLEP
jgi:hypothetical protein